MHYKPCLSLFLSLSVSQGVLRRVEDEASFGQSFVCSVSLVLNIETLLLIGLELVIDSCLPLSSVFTRPDLLLLDGESVPL